MPYAARAAAVSSVRAACARVLVEHVQLARMEEGQRRVWLHQRVLLQGVMEAPPNMVGGREAGSRPVLPGGMEARLAVLAALVCWMDTKDGEAV